MSTLLVSDLHLDPTRPAATELFGRFLDGEARGADALLRNLIHERTGLFFENGRCDLLTDKLAPLVRERGLDSFLDYYYLLKYDADAGVEWAQVINALSVQETYFRREPDQVQALTDALLPRLAVQADPLRIWSAACATGEEPLTLAMALDEAGWFARRRIEIHAGDASSAAIEKARRGLYRERSLRYLSPAQRERYFHAEAGGWRIAPELHARIHWHTANLMNPAEISASASAPVIFCRNVFIYFSEQAIRQTVRLFAECMPSPGYLFTGAAESLLKVTTEFELQEIGGAFVYVKTAPPRER